MKTFLLLLTLLTGISAHAKNFNQQKFEANLRAIGLQNTVEAQAATNGCGQIGKIADRILDCAKKEPERANEIARTGLSLVTVTEIGQAIVRDEVTSLLWFIDNSRRSYFSAYDICKKTVADLSNLKELTWQLPTSDQVFKLNEHEDIYHFFNLFWAFKVQFEYFWVSNSTDPGSYRDGYGYAYTSFGVRSWSGDFDFYYTCVANINSME